MKAYLLSLTLSALALHTTEAKQVMCKLKFRNSNTDWQYCSKFGAAVGSKVNV